MYIHVYTYVCSDELWWSVNLGEAKVVLMYNIIRVYYHNFIYLQDIFPVGRLFGQLFGRS